jgi:hypothetical protein
MARVMNLPKSKSLSPSAIEKNRYIQHFMYFVRFCILIVSGGGGGERDIVNSLCPGRGGGVVSGTK